MDEPRRDKQVGLKLTDVELAELRQASAYANMELAPWCRRELINAARGERVAKNVEVPRADLEELKAAQQRNTTVLLALLSEVLEHTHHGDPRYENEDANLRSLGRKRAARKMDELMHKLGLNGSDKP
jgi:hypothetical protein